MRTFFKVDQFRFGDKNIRLIFVIGIFISLILTPVYILFQNEYTKDKIDENAVITTAIVVEVKRINKKLPQVIYKFSVNDTTYYGQCEFNYSDSLVLRSIINIKYISDKPESNSIFKYSEMEKDKHNIIF